MTLRVQTNAFFLKQCLTFQKEIWKKVVFTINLIFLILKALLLLCEFCFGHINFDNIRFEKSDFYTRDEFSVRIICNYQKKIRRKNASILSSFSFFIFFNFFFLFQQ